MHQRRPGAEAYRKPSTAQEVQRAHSGQVIYVEGRGLPAR